MQGYDLYQVCGDWGDWMYSVYHVPAYTIEVYYDKIEYSKLTKQPTQKFNGSWYIPFNVTKFFNPNEKNIVSVASPNYKAVVELSYTLIPPEETPLNWILPIIVGIMPFMEPLLLLLLSGENIKEDR